MINIQPILAASQIELVIGIIVFIIWVVGALAGKLKGAPRPPQQANGPSPVERLQQEIADQIQRMHGYQAPPPLPPQVSRPAPTAPQQASRQWPQPEVPQQRAPKQRQPKKPKQPRMAFADVPPPPLPRSSPIIAQPLPAKPAVTAPHLRRMLNPAALRQQFILTEILQPPMSMRREDR